MVEKKEIKERVHRRLMKSVQRKQTQRRYARITFVVTLVLCIFVIRQFHSQIFPPSAPALNKGQHLIADFTDGYVSYPSEDSLHFDQLSEKKVYTPLKVEEKEGVVIVEAIDGALGQDDSVSLRIKKGGFYKVILPDGSCVYLNSESQLVYTGNYMQDRRVGVRGEAYFEVKPFKNQHIDVPFFVETRQQKIEVLGTSFNVRMRGDVEETTLVSGKIKLNTASNEVLLTPNEKSSVSGNKIVKTERVDTESFTAWKDGYFSYENQPLVSILRDLSFYYDIKFNKEDIPDVRYTFFLDRKNTFADVISVIEKSSSVRIDVQGNRLLFNKG